MTRLRPFAGPLLVGLAGWCAAGHLTVVSASDAALRLAVPAPWWTFVLAAALAMLVGPWRRRPLLAVPALLATLPWWPVWLPPVALVWTGPMAWVPVGLALLAAAGDRLGTTPVLEADGALSRPLGAAPRASVAVAAGLTFVLGLATAWSIAPRTPGGDEPHYLIITESLLRDGDLRIENNHRNRDYQSFYKHDLPPDYIQRGQDGEIYSIHAPGVSVLVLPAFAVWGYHGAVATFLLIAALTGGLIWSIGWRATGDRGAAWAGWAVAVTSCTFLLQSVTIFPDGPGMLVMASAVWLALRLADRRERVGVRAIVTVSALLAAMPWLHTRFAVLAGAFGLILGVLILVRGETPRARAQGLAAFLALPLVSAVAWLAFFKVIYGTYDPSAPYGATGAGGRLAYVPGGLLGLLVDQQFGAIAYAPALGAAIVGLFVRPRRAGVRPVMLACGGALVLYLAVATSYWMWWAGVPATPARLAATVIPVLALPAAVLWQRVGATGRTAVLGLVAVSALVTICLFGVDRGALAWNDRNGQALWLEWLSPVVSLVRGWPSFFWRLSPDDLRTEWAFALHAGVWVATLVGVPAAAVAVVRSRGATTRMAVFAIGAGLGLMAAVEAGWWLNGVDGVRAARSQFAVLDDARNGRAIAIGWARLGRYEMASGALDIRPDAPGRTDEPLPWIASFSDVPAGVYQLELSTGRPLRGQLTISRGLLPEPMQTWPVLPLSRQQFELRLDKRTSFVTVAVDPALRAVGTDVRLVAAGRRPDGPAAR